MILHRFKISLIFQFLLVLVLACSSMTALAAMNPGAKTYNARFCEIEEAYANQAHAMKSMNGITNITDQPVTITCPVIKMKRDTGTTTSIYYGDVLYGVMPKRDEMVIFRTKPNLGGPVPDEQLVSCTLYQMDQAFGGIVSAVTNPKIGHRFMTFITIYPQGFWPNYSMECIIPPGETINGYEFTEGDDELRF